MNSVLSFILIASFGIFCHSLSEADFEFDVLSSKHKFEYDVFEKNCISAIKSTVEDCLDNKKGNLNKKVEVDDKILVMSAIPPKKIEDGSDLLVRVVASTPGNCEEWQKYVFVEMKDMNKEGMTCEIELDDFCEFELRTDGSNGNGNRRLAGGCPSGRRKWGGGDPIDCVGGISNQTMIEDALKEISTDENHGVPSYCQNKKLEYLAQCCELDVKDFDFSSPDHTLKATSGEYDDGTEPKTVFGTYKRGDVVRDQIIVHGTTINDGSSPVTLSRSIWWKVESTSTWEKRCGDACGTNKCYEEKCSLLP